MFWGNLEIRIITGSVFMKSGYLFVLSHPSDSELIKVGYTTGTLKKALERVNTNSNKEAGQIAKSTGKDWKVKKSIKVQDPSYAKATFWDTSAQHAFRGNQDVSRMSWAEVEVCLGAAEKVGVRPDPKPKRDKDWMLEKLKGTGIKMIGDYRGLITRIDFEFQGGEVFKIAPAALAAAIDKADSQQ